MVRTMEHLRDVWGSQLSKRVLFNTDLLAYSTTLMVLTASLARLRQHLPSDQLEAFRFGPQQPLFSTSVVFFMYGSTAAAALLMLAIRPAIYFQQRWRICVSIRMIRLVVQLSTMLTPAAVAALTGVMVARGKEAPQKATAILIIQPLAYYIQPAMVLLPWRHVLLMQLVSTAGMLHWLWLFPCFLQDLQQQELQLIHRESEKYCSSVQSVLALFRAGVGCSASDLTEAACIGLPAMQTLQIFVNLVFLLGLPVLLAYTYEHWLHTRFSAVQPRPHAPPTAVDSTDVLQAGSGASSSRQASSSAGSLSTSLPLAAASTTSGGLSATHVRGSDAQARMSTLLSGGVGGVGTVQSHRHMLYQVLVLVAVLPTMWLLAELIAQAFEANRECGTILVAAGAT